MALGFDPGVRILPWRGSACEPIGIEHHARVAAHLGEHGRAKYEDIRRAFGLRNEAALPGPSREAPL